MKAYPEIPYRVNSNIDIYAFDKFDGSNIRIEWNRKNQFTRFGTRRRLLRPDDRVFGEVPELAKPFEEPLTRILMKNRIQEATFFFEFWGKYSFAGQHRIDESHNLTLLDVSIYKKGFLSPANFLKWFGNLNIPKMLFYGRCGTHFINQVRTSNLSDMSFEGVVCKGVSRKRVKMFKIKSRAWINRIKSTMPEKVKNLLDESELREELNV